MYVLYTVIYLESSAQNCDALPVTAPTLETSEPEPESEVGSLLMFSAGEVRTYRATDSSSQSDNEMKIFVCDHVYYIALCMPFIHEKWVLIFDEQCILVLFSYGRQYVKLYREHWQEKDISLSQTWIYCIQKILPSLVRRIPKTLYSRV